MPPLSCAVVIVLARVTQDGLGGVIRCPAQGHAAAVLLAVVGLAAVVAVIDKAILLAPVTGDPKEQAVLDQRTTEIGARYALVAAAQLGGEPGVGVLSGARV